MHVEPIWLAKRLVATDDQLCRGDFLQTIEQILICIPIAANFLQIEFGRIMIDQ